MSTVFEGYNNVEYSRHRLLETACFCSLIQGTELMCAVINKTNYELYHTLPVAACNTSYASYEFMQCSSCCAINPNIIVYILALTMGCASRRHSFCFLIPSMKFQLSLNSWEQVIDHMLFNYAWLPWCSYLNYTVNIICY